MKRVLILGADHSIVALLSGASELAGCAFEVAAGGADALHRLRRRAYDAVVTSPQTPVEEDIALLEEMRELRPGVKAILLAPSATPDQVISAMRARAFACFGAPVDPVELTGMVRRAVAETRWRDDIELRSADPGWISLRVGCRPITAERLVQFFSELPGELSREDRDGLMFAFREILMNAMEHGAGFDPDKVVEVAAVRTERTIVFYVRDPGPGFRGDALAHAASTDDPLAHVAEREAKGLRPGGFGLLLVRKIVDELIYSEKGNEVLLIKHVG